MLFIFANMYPNMNLLKSKNVHFCFNLLTGQEVTITNDIAWLIPYYAQ